MSGCVWRLSTAVQQRKFNNVDLKVWILWKCNLFFKDWCRSARTFCSADEGVVCLVALLKSEETDSIPRVGEIQFYWVTNVFNVRLNQDVQELRLQLPSYGVLSWKTASQWTLHWCSVFQTNAAQMGFFFLSLVFSDWWSSCSKTAVKERMFLTRTRCHVDLISVMEQSALKAGAAAAGGGGSPSGIQRMWNGRCLCLHTSLLLICYCPSGGEREGSLIDSKAIKLMKYILYIK